MTDNKNDNRQQDMQQIMRLLQFTDSTFPVGTFSFSNGLETASYMEIVKTKDELEVFARSQSRQAAFSDGIAALHSHKYFLSGDIDACREMDEYLMMFKMNAESRLMLKRMGKKLAELAVRLFPDNEFIAQWLDDIKNERTPGSYPVTQGIVFACAGVGEEQLFCSHQYGVINMVLSAALRCVKVSHYDTQEILENLSGEIGALYAQASQMEPKDMNSFFPELDIIASLHEKGNMRMFMN